jgi:type IV pilus assembly protein PilW
MPRTFRSGKTSAAQRGFSIVELSIAVLVALFLLGGLITLVMGTRKTSATQSAVSQLQDNQRIAMTLLTNAVQKAGYYPDPTTQRLSSFISEAALAGVALPASQVVGGAYSAAAPGDTLLVRFYAPASDTNKAIIDCAGQSNSSGSPNVWYTNAFQIQLVNGVSWLQCASRTSGAGGVLTVNLIPNVTNMQVLYGVASSAAGDDFSIVQYLNASQMSAANWLNVTVVKVTLSFLVPAYGSTGGQMTTNISFFTRVIPIMSRAGVDT